MPRKTSASLQSLQLLKDDILNYTKWNLVARTILFQLVAHHPYIKGLASLLVKILH